MTTGLVIGIATLAGIIVLALGRRSRIGDAVGLAGLIATTAIAATIGTETLILGSHTIVESEYVRLFLVLGGSAAAVLAVIGLAVGGPTSTPGVALLTLAAGAMALAVIDPVIAMLASTAAAVAAAVVVADRRSGPRITVAARALRATVVAGLLGTAGVIWLIVATGRSPLPGIDGVDGSGGNGLDIGGPLGDAGTVFGPGLVGLAYLAVTLGLAVRLGAIPFHGWAARVAEVTPPSGLPATLALGPAALAVVVIGWLDGSVASLGEPLIVERWIVLLIGAASLVLGAIAAWLHDDLEHVVAYSLVQDAGIILLAAAALDPAGWAPVRLWILTVIVVKSALAAWAAATRHAFGTRRVAELGGWARRSPLLAIAFVVILVSAVGLPGLAAFNARAELIALVADGPFAALLLLGALAPLGYLGRILVVGFGRPSQLVREAASGRPSLGAARMSTPGRLISAAWRLNRAPIAASLVLALAALGFLTSAGGFGVLSAAAEPAPGRSPTESFDPDGPGGAGGSLAPEESPTGSATGPIGSVEPSLDVTGSGTPSSSTSGGPEGSEPSAAPSGASPSSSFEPVATPSG